MRQSSDLSLASLSLDLCLVSLAPDLQVFSIFCSYYLHQRGNVLFVGLSVCKDVRTCGAEIK